MVWSDEKDFVMLKEVAGEGVFNSKPGRRERGGSWQFAKFTVNARAVRDRFNNISKKLKAKLAKEATESGGGEIEEQSELEMLLEQIIELNE